MKNKPNSYKLYDLYINQNKTKLEIAKLYNLKPNQITWLLHIYKICKRKPGMSTTEEFIEKAKKVHGDNYEYNQVIYKGNNIKVKIFCNKCKKYFSQTPRSHLCGKGCKECSKKKRLLKNSMSLSDFIKKARRIHGNKYDYTQTNYINSYTKVKIHCNQCNNDFLQDPHSHLKRKGCPYCKQSKGETRIKVWLDVKKIKYKTQYRFYNCRNKLPLPFDFYLPDYNTCIEFQGAQHYFSVMQSNLAKSETIGKIEFVNLQKRDEIKRDYCKKNNIFLLEIKYNEKVEEKLENFFENIKK